MRLVLSAFVLGIPTFRLRELEVLERVTEKANLSVILADGGLTDRVIKML